MLHKQMGISFGRSFTRRSGRVANSFKRSGLNGKGRAAVMAAAAGMAGLYAAMRFFRKGPGSGSVFDVQPSEGGGWTVRASETFGTRGQAMDVARRATEALRSRDIAGNPLELPDNGVSRPWSGSASGSSSTGSTR